MKKFAYGLRYDKKLQYGTTLGWVEAKSEEDALTKIKKDTPHWKDVTEIGIAEMKARKL